MSRPSFPLGRQAGATYVEVLIASLLIVISIVPMSDAVRGAISGSALHEEVAVQQLHLTAMMEEVLAEPFSSLEEAAVDAGSRTKASSYSDPQNSASRRLVYLSLIDGDNADGDDDTSTGVDPGLMWIRAEIEGTQLSIETLVSR